MCPYHSMERKEIFMGNTLVITEENHHIITATLEDGKVSQFQVESREGAGILGNIYVGKVRNIVKNIDAAFVEFGPDMMGYLSLHDNVLPVHTQTRKQEDGRILIGDEIIVQVSREALKTKPPALTGKVNFPGKYLAVVYGDSGLGISRKIKGQEKKEMLRKVLNEYATEEYGIIARTNSANASPEELRQELHQLVKRYHDTMASGMHRAPHACLYRAPEGFLTSITDAYEAVLEEVITDSKRLYKRIVAYLEENGWQDRIPVKFWQKEWGKVQCVYNIDRELRHALSQKVWLKSGGYLIIQPTEALVVIDVNSGKAISKKKMSQTGFLNINKEAALEIAHQIRLRNLSGMIVVDFIDMKGEEIKQELLDFFSKELEKDRIPTKLVDMTRLGLVEITRKKVRKPLHEQMRAEREL